MYEQLMQIVQLQWITTTDIGFTLQFTSLAISFSWTKWVLKENKH